MRNINLRSVPLESPLGERRLPPLRPTARPRTLKSKKVMLLDNSQVGPESVNYGDLFGRLEEGLRRNYEAGAVIRFSRNLLAENQESVRAIVPEIKATGADAVIIGVCHAGVTQPSTMLAIELEKANIPAALICTSLGFGLALVSASASMTGLPIVQAKPVHGLTEEAVARDTQELLAGLTRGLSGTPGGVERQFQALVKEKGKLVESAPLGPFAANVQSTEPGQDVQLEIDPSVLDEQLYEDCCSRYLCDGLPVIAPTKQRVKAMLRFTDRDPDEVLLKESLPSGNEMTVRKVAVNAVLAGCKPEYFPIVLTACQAMTQNRYRLFQASITTHPSGNMVIVSGPLAKEIGMNSEAGCLGPGVRANATIGRALTLCMFNICRSIPGFSDLSTFGSPAEYTYCFAESDANNPWEPLHQELYDKETTTVTVHKCEAPHNAIDNLGKEPEQVLASIASVAATFGGNNATVPSELIVIMNPSVARPIAEKGWSKTDVKYFLYDRSRNSGDVLRTSIRKAIHWPAWFFHANQVPVVHRPEDILLVVAGGTGPHSMVAIPWGFARAVTMPVAFKDGRPVRSVYDIAQ